MKRAFLFVLAMALLAACGGTSPEPDYYTLTAVPGSSAPSDVNVSIKIERPILPDYLDRPGIVRQNGDKVTIDDLHRWADPLDTLFERLLAEDLRQRMPGSYITTEKDDTPQKTRFVIETDIETFNQTDQGPLLVAQINLIDHNDCGYTTPQSVPFRAGSSQGDEIAGLSALIGQAADKVSTMIQQKKAAEICCQNSFSALCAKP